MNIDLYMHRYIVDPLFGSTSLRKCQGKKTCIYAGLVQASPHH